MIFVSSLANGRGGSRKYVCQACDFADLANRSSARGAPGCECGVARPYVKGQPVDVKQSILHAWHLTQHSDNDVVESAWRVDAGFAWHAVSIAEHDRVGKS